MIPFKPAGPIEGAAHTMERYKEYCAINGLPSPELTDDERLAGMAKWLTPFQRAKAWNEAHPEVLPWPAQLAYYGAHGFIWSSPTAFVLATYDQEESEWFVGVAAGNWWELFAIAPHPAKWACFVRRGVEHRWDYSRIQKLANKRYGLLTKET